MQNKDMLPNILGGNSTGWRTIPRRGVLSFCHWWWSFPGILPLNLVISIISPLCSPAHLSTASWHVFLECLLGRLPKTKLKAHSSLDSLSTEMIIMKSFHWKCPSAFSVHLSISCKNKRQVSKSILDFQLSDSFEIESSVANLLPDDLSWVRRTKVRMRSRMAETMMKMSCCRLGLVSRSKASSSMANVPTLSRRSVFPSLWALDEEDIANWTKTHLSRRWRQSWEDWRSTATRSSRSELPAPSVILVGLPENYLLCSSLTPVCSLHN